MARVDGGAQGVSRILGTTMPTREKFLDLEWVEALHGLSSRGVTLAAFQSWARKVALEDPFTPDMDSIHSRKSCLDGSARGVSRILGTTMPTREKFLDLEWVEALHGLSSRGVTLAAFQSWARKVALGDPFTPDMDSIHSRKSGLEEVLPDLFLNKVALMSKTPTLRLYISRLNQRRFHEEAYLKEIKAHFELYKFKYWGRLDVTITVRCKLEKGVPKRVREFYDRVSPYHQQAICETVQEGAPKTPDYIQPWIMRCGSFTGSHRTKKVARMIAIIKRFVDPSFDPEDGDPEASGAKSPNSRKRKFEEMKN